MLIYHYKKERSDCMIDCEDLVKEGLERFK